MNRHALDKWIKLSENSGFPIPQEITLEYNEYESLRADLINEGWLSLDDVHEMEIKYHHAHGVMLVNQGTRNHCPTCGRDY